MRIISRRTLRDFYEKHPASKGAIEAWYAEAKNAEWKGPAEIKAQYATVSFVKNNRVIFNIGGNKYRLVVHVRYDLKILFIRFIGTHSEYDRIDAESI